MQNAIAAAVVAVSFTSYPSAGDKPPTVPRPATNPRVEMATDKGPIIEMVVRCPKGTAIISYSKMERLFCSPKMACGRNLPDIVAASCG